MLGKLHLRFDQQASLIKTVEVSLPTSYSQIRSMMFGFIPTNGGSSSMIDSNSSLRGRASTVSLAKGEIIAQLIQEQFSLPVLLIKAPKATMEEAPEVGQKGEKGNRQLNGDEPAEVSRVSALQVDDASQCRRIIRFLEERQFIVAQDRDSLNHFIDDVEAQLALAEQLTPEIDQKQKQILLTFCAPHIDAIIDACKNEAPTQEAILGNVTWLQIDASCSRRDLALALLLQSTQQDAASLFHEQFNGLSDFCRASAKAIHLMFKGVSQLESIFTEASAGIPFLTKQRQALLELIEEKLTEQFGPEAVPEQNTKSLTKEQMQALRARLFCDGFHLDAVRLTQVDDEEQKVVSLQPFQAVFDALEGNFGSMVVYGDTFSEYQPKHRWFAPNGEILEGEAARNRFLKILAEVAVSS